MSKELMAKAGTWNVVCGALFMCTGVIVLGFVVAMGSGVAIGGGPRTTPGSAAAVSTLGAPAFALLVGGVLILASGLSARRGERWSLALVGSLLSLPVPFVGMMSSILLVKARNDWSGTRRWVAYVALGLAGLACIVFWCFASFI